MKNYVNSTHVANRSLRKISYAVLMLGTVVIIYAMVLATLGHDMRFSSPEDTHSVSQEAQIWLVVGMMMFLQSASVLFLTKSN
jgi:uncharacterized membrane protein YidH (DUF202 family)